MGQKWSKVYSDTASIPGAAPTSFFNSCNISGGPIQSIMLRLEMVSGAQVAATDVSTLLTQCRLTLNGDSIHDWRAIGADNTSVQPGRYGFFLNSTGGRYGQVLNATAPDAWFEIPVGINTPSGNNRLEIATSWLAAASAITSGEFSVWIRYNTDIKEVTLVAPSTSFLSSVSLEQVVVRVPSTEGMVVDSLFVQSADDTDSLGVQGIRLNALGSYGMSASMLRFLVDDLNNGITYADEATSVTQCSYAVERLGCFVIPTFGLTGGDIPLTIDSTAALNRTYGPVLRGPVGSSSIGGGIQTQQVPGEPSSALVAAVAN